MTTDIPTMIDIAPNWTASDPVPGNGYPYKFPVLTCDVITALQAAGYEIFEAHELPAITRNGPLQGGGPKLPSHWGQPKPGQTRAQQLYEEALGKLALARWWEKEEARREKRIHDLAIDLGNLLQHNDMPKFAADLVDRGWTKT